MYVYSKKQANVGRIDVCAAFQVLDYLRQNKSKRDKGLHTELYMLDADYIHPCQCLLKCQQDTLII